MRGLLPVWGACWWCPLLCHEVFCQRLESSCVWTASMACAWANWNASRCLCLVTLMPERPRPNGARLWMRLEFYAMHFQSRGRSMFSVHRSSFSSGNRRMRMGRKGLIGAHEWPPIMRWRDLWNASCVNSLCWGWISRCFWRFSILASQISKLWRAF